MIFTYLCTAKKLKPYNIPNNKMKKILLLFTACLLCVSTMQAVPAKRGFKTFNQADGKTITLQMVGDEFHHSILTQDGLTVQRAGDGKFYYSTASGITMTEAEGTENEVEVFTLTGISLGKFADSAKAKESLEHGVYILKSKSETLKITVR